MAMEAEQAAEQGTAHGSVLGSVTSSKNQLGVDCKNDDGGQDDEDRMIQLLEQQERGDREGTTTDGAKECRKEENRYTDIHADGNANDCGNSSKHPNKRQKTEPALQQKDSENDDAAKRLKQFIHGKCLMIASETGQNKDIARALLFHSKGNAQAAIDSYRASCQNLGPQLSQRPGTLQCEDRLAC